MKHIIIITFNFFEVGAGGGGGVLGGACSYMGSVLAVSVGEIVM